MTSPLIAEAIGLRQEALEALVQRRLGGRVRHLRIVVRANGMILQGSASTYHAKQLAQHAAMELGRLPIVANDIEVR
jgi:hypothetical protein